MSEDKEALYRRIDRSYLRIAFKDYGNALARTDFQEAADIVDEAVESLLPAIES